MRNSANAEEPEAESEMAKNRDKQMEEMEKSLNFMSKELSKVSKQQITLMALIGEVKQLQTLIQQKDEKIVAREKRVDDLEQYSRIEDVIISGLSVKPRSYARAVAGAQGETEDPSPEETQSIEAQVIEFLDKQNIEVDSRNIVACHTLPRKNGKNEKNAKPAIIVRFANRKQKEELLRQGKKLKGTDVYLNEHLTKKNGEIAKEARILRKKEKIRSTWTRNCKVLIRTNGETPEETRVITVRELKDLQPYR